jgi:Cu-processing system permease protein
MFTGLAFSMTLSFFIGVGIPVLLYECTATGLSLIITGILLTVIFVSIAMLASVKIRDKARGIGAAILLWLFFSLLFDGLLLFILFQFSDYPLEKTMVGLTMLNPIDLGRIMVLLKMDVSAMMGYSGAVFKDFFGTTAGLIATQFILMLWIAIPAWLSVRNFNRKDL